jgi:hypothetical protein
MGRERAAEERRIDWIHEEEPRVFDTMKEGELEPTTYFIDVIPYLYKSRNRRSYKCGLGVGLGQRSGRVHGRARRERSERHGR